MKKEKVILLSDLLEAINKLPNCSNGYSDVYDKGRILRQINDLPLIEIELVSK